MSRRSISRRKFVRDAAAAGALATLAPELLFAAKPGSGVTTRNPLYLPPTLSHSGTTVTAAPGTVALGGSRTTRALAYNGTLPGPTFRATRGAGVNVTLINNLADETTIHWHGMVVPTIADGHPMDAVMPGGSYAYSYTINQRAALNWYHPHPHMMTGEQVCLGLAGAFIVNDAEEAALGLPSGAREVPLIIRDANFDRTGNLTYNPKSSGFLGNTPLVNGTLNPTLSVDRALYRFRVLNGANARVFRLALSAGSMWLIGNDGGLLETSVPVNEVTVSPGERLDLLIDFRSFALGAKPMLRCLGANWNLLELNVANAVSDPSTVPTTLSSITHLANPVTTREFSFDGMSRINGQEFEMDRIDFTVPRGVVERWRFRTGGNAPHPVHIHGASFQVQSRTGGRGQLFAWEGGWKDTVLLNDGETVEVLIRFDAFPGIYLLHCHKLEHEDMGMMSNFEVI